MFGLRFTMEEHGDASEHVDASDEPAIPFPELQHVSLLRNELELKFLIGPGSSAKDATRPLWWEWVYLHDRLQLRASVGRYLNNLNIAVILRQFCLPKAAVHISKGIDYSRRKAVPGDTHVCTSSGLLTMVMNAFQTSQTPIKSKVHALTVLQLFCALLLPLASAAGVCFMLACDIPGGVWTAQDCQG